MLCHIRVLAWHRWVSQCQPWPWPLTQGPSSPHQMISSPDTTSGLTTPSCLPLIISVLPLVVSIRAPTHSASVSPATLDPTVSGKGHGTHVSGASDTLVPCSHWCGRKEVVLVKTAEEMVGSAPSVLSSRRISFSPFQPANALLLSLLMIYCVTMGVFLSYALP